MIVIRWIKLRSLCYKVDEDYQTCRDAWETKRRTELSDFLDWYNNLDVQPFLLTLEKQCAVYAEKSIDMVKDAISLPGLDIQWLFDETGKPPSIGDCMLQQNPDMEDYIRVRKVMSKSRVVYLVDKSDWELFRLFEENVVGEPSIVFHRYHEEDVTKTKESEFGERALLCKKIEL